MCFGDQYITDLHFKAKLIEKVIKKVMSEYKKCCFELKVSFEQVVSDFVYCIRQSKRANLEKLIHAILVIENADWH